MRAVKQRFVNITPEGPGRVSGSPIQFPFEISIFAVDHDNADDFVRQQCAIAEKQLDQFEQFRVAEELLSGSVRVCNGDELQLLGEQFWRTTLETPAAK